MGLRLRFQNSGMRAVRPILPWPISLKVLIGGSPGDPRTAVFHKYCSWVQLLFTSTCCELGRPLGSGRKRFIYDLDTIRSAFDSFLTAASISVGV